MNLDDMQASMYEIFAFETNGFLESIEKILMKSETDGADILSSVPEIFRYMHTIKSSSAMMSFDNISRLAHATEDLFGFIRDKHKGQVDQARLTDLVLDCVDFIKRNMQPGSSEDPKEKIAAVGAFLEALKAPPPEADRPARSAPEAPGAPEGMRYILHVTFEQGCQMPGLRAFEVENKLKKAVLSVTSDLGSEAEDAWERVRRDGLTLTVTATQTVEEIKALIKASPFVESVRECLPEAQDRSAPQPDAGTQNAAPAAGFVERRADRGAAFANVAVKKLDNLIDLACETVIADMRLRHIAESGDLTRAGEAFEALGKLILQVQQVALSIRMLSVQETFHKLNRSVRDMVRRQDKEVQFVTRGEDTEVDKSVVDSIFTPLIHIIRNAIDHGIETPREREAAGKPRQGVVTLTAISEGSDVTFTVTDDGRGFEHEKILGKALSSGLIDEAQAARMTEDEINALIFVPGFSTNETVTEFSGRGVGMDVVYDSMKRLGGKVRMKSARGVGTEITLKIPLTLAILDALILRVGDELTALPLSTVSEIFVAAPGSVREVNGRDTVLFRENCYRVVSLADFYEQGDRTAFGDGVMLLVRHEHEQFVLFADEVVDHKSVVVKPVPRLLREVRGVYGCTILGDGRVSLILDVGGFCD